MKKTKQISLISIAITFCFQALAGTVIHWSEMDFVSLHAEIYKNKIPCESSKNILSLKPIKIEHYKGNCVVTLKESATSESGFILMLPKSLYVPITNKTYEIKNMKKGNIWFYLFNKIKNT